MLSCVSIVDTHFIYVRETIYNVIIFVILLLVQTWISFEQCSVRYCRQPSFHFPTALDWCPRLRNDDRNQSKINSIGNNSWTFQFNVALEKWTSHWHSSENVSKSNHLFDIILTNRKHIITGTYLLTSISL